MPPTAPQSVLSQQCHSTQRQRPPFCLAPGLKNQSHVQEIHPACLSNTEWPIVRGSAADLEGLPIFGALATANRSQVWRPSLTHQWPGWTHTNTHRIVSCHDLAGGFTLNNKSSLVPLLHACGSVAVYCPSLLKSVHVCRCVCVYFPMRVNWGQKDSLVLEDSEAMTSQVLPK